MKKAKLIIIEIVLRTLKVIAEVLWECRGTNRKSRRR